MSILIKNGALICLIGPRTADLRTVEDKIVQIGAELPTGDSRVIDASGKLVFPGFIDTHTHFEMNKGPPGKRQTTGPPVPWPLWRGAPPPCWTSPSRSVGPP